MTSSASNDPDDDLQLPPDAAFSTDHHPRGPHRLREEVSASCGSDDGENDDIVDELASAQRIEAGPAHHDIRGELDALEQNDADDAEAALRRQVDAQLFERLVADRFDGPVWDVACHELARYGIAVLRSWLRTGRMSWMLENRGLRIQLGESELRAFAQDFDERTDLAMLTVGHALADFRKRGLEDRGWNPSGGAQITTYFIGGCLLAFPNRLRERRSHLKKVAHPVDTDDRESCLGDVIETPAGLGIDPARKVASAVELDEVCASLRPKEKQVVALMLQGLEQSQIAAELGMTERSVEGVLYRMRNRLDPNRS